MPSSPFRIDKPVAVITASTSGIGLATAHALAARDYHVIISSRSPTHIKTALSDLHALHGPDSASGIPCHVAIPDHRKELISFVQQRATTISALILNAAVSTAFGPALEVTEAQWDKMFEVNVKAAFFMIKDMQPLLANGSSIVLVTSAAAYNPIPRLGAYSITKTALLGICKVLSTELASKGIRVNAVAPGLIQTRFSEALWKTKDGRERNASDSFGWIPMGRIGKPDEVAPLIAFLASEDARYITGETVVVGGGINSKL
eukprot:GFKZ01013829.1.p1 GENE.GFKZ01013829.1~~GFKZ01013829.1.p1  ORF type:complete len:270 (-),score=30.39 GFKZ01013829.1:1276-2058(-)